MQRAWQQIGGLTRRFLLWLRHPHAIIVVATLVWVVAFDGESLRNIYLTQKRVNALRDEAQYYHERIATDQARLHELRTNEENLEKFAREHYFMRREHEDLFVVQ